MLVFTLALLAGLAVLVYSADIFVAGTASIARNLGVPPLIIGLTIVGFGTSAPEILVSAIASWEGSTGLAVGNAIGSNIANIGLILGVTALIKPITVHSRMLKREIPLLFLICSVCYLLAFDGLDRSDGIIMLIGLVVFVAWLVRSGMQSRNRDMYKQEVAEELPALLSSVKSWLYFIIGLAGLLVSSKLLIWAAVNIATYFGVSDLVIGLTIVALGTSLPELAASVMSVIKKEDDLAIGNIVGSNMYNMLAVYSMPGLIAPGVLSEWVIYRDFPVMLIFTFILFLSGYGVLSNPGRIIRLEGLIFLGGYLAYQWLVFSDSALAS